jgi:HlyD family secretion protein
MKTRYILLLAAVAFVLIGGAAVKPASEFWKKHNRPKWREAETKRGTIIAVVNSTGTVRPVLLVQVGSFVSGPIKELHVDFNEQVTEGQLLAKVDPRLFEANVARDRAVLATREAEVARAKAQLEQAENDQERASMLLKENPDFVSDAELDELKFKRIAQDAALKVAMASVDQAQASLDNSLLNLEYTEITSPVDGVIIDRLIAPGQTLAAQFQTPELFLVAPDMREKMYVNASVDEADIGMIRNAQDKGQPVHFTVDAYQDDLFEGVIEEIRLSALETQNVVTYPVVVAATNPDLKLLPGMTATISFRVDERKDVIRIPNSALRFYPDKKHVRKEDQKILEGKGWEDDNDDDQADVVLSAEERAAARKKRNRRHVWVAEEGKLKAVEVTTGLSDSKYSELLTGDLKEGQKLVTGIEPKKGFGE